MKERNVPLAFRGIGGSPTALPGRIIEERPGERHDRMAAKLQQLAVEQAEVEKSDDTTGS
ncbi:MAG: hypothetical protein JWM46_78 [Candidatus Kaiserbacteria bacterium]|nr:hypothetical protein [Candidatus Kaiserbacteria bacterium]